MARLSALLLLVLTVSACALSREAVIEGKLEKAGMKPRLAHCMAHKLDERLSDDQLKKLAAAAKAPDDGGHLGARKLVERLATVDDPQIVDTVSHAALHCALAD